MQNKTIYLVGTAHVSKSSVVLVEEAIKNILPDTVAVELCKSRYDSLKDPERWKKTDIISIIKSGKAYLLMAQLLLSAFQKKIGKNLEITPGAEMLKAIEISNANNLEIVLADREIRTTLRRAWSSLGFWSSIKLLSSVLTGMFSDHTITEEEIEKLKSKDMLQSMIVELGQTLPEVQIALIDERDRYLAGKIAQAPGSKIVAVVGAGHVPGITKYINQDIDLSELDKEPPKSTTSKIITWGVPIFLVAVLVYGFFVGGSNTSIEMITSWIIITGFFAGLGALAAMAHPITILSAAIAAPITTIHPLIAAGWVAGIVEAMIRKPKVSDLENIGEDLSTVKGLWNNRLSRILLIIAFTNIGGMIGMFVGVPFVASLI